MSAEQKAERSNRLLGAFPEAIQTHLKRSLSHVVLQQGKVCFRAGELIDRVYFPTSGLISFVISTRGGGFVETGMIGSEGAAGLQAALAARPSFARAIIQAPGGFWIASAEPLRQFVRSSEEARGLINDYTEILWAEAQQLAACNAVHKSLSRLARWLLQSSDRVSSNELQFTQKFLSQMLGLNRTSITLLAKELQERDIIKYGRGSIVILDRAKLEEAACECYRIIRGLYRRETGSAS